MARKATRATVESVPEPENHQLDLPCIAESAAARRSRKVPPTEGVILIDLENTQPDNLEILAGRPFRVFVFTGENQSKISLNFAEAMQRLGARAEYVRMSGSGPNALDFHIAYYAGELAAHSPGAHFYIVSRDRGFDPLIRHLAGRTEHPVEIRRVRDFTEIPGLPNARPPRFNGQLEAAIQLLVKRGATKPLKLKTLTNTIESALGKKIKQGDAGAIVTELVARGVVIVDGTSVSYALPAE